MLTNNTKIILAKWSIKSKNKYKAHFKRMYWITAEFSFEIIKNIQILSGVI